MEETSNNHDNGNNANTVLCSVEFPVIWEERKYYGIEKFDCHVVDLFTTPTHEGGYCTVIPISDKEYRKKNPTKAAVKIEKEKDWTIFNIYSDWGGLSVMKIHNSLNKEIEFATKAAISRMLLIN